MGSGITFLDKNPLKRYNWAVVTIKKAIIKKLTKEAKKDFMEYLKEFNNSEMQDRFIKIIIDL